MPRRLGNGHGHAHPDLDSPAGEAGDKELDAVNRLMGFLREDEA
ncbi:MAG TPA: hypothetical protein VFB77_19100 [Acidimicrobiales bacterium]|nr:hypothetical protein [Acidimicrobiales bacterium]